MIPNIVQSIIWQTWKRIHWIKHSDQLEFWKSDYLISGLEFELERPSSSSA